MIAVKGSSAIEAMRTAGRITAEAIALARDAAKPGISTLELDKIVRTHIEKNAGVPSFLGYGGFPASVCVSINNEVIHGIPSKSRFLCEGDIVSIDVGVKKNGYHADAADTFGVGTITAAAQSLIATTKDSFFAGIANALPDKRIGDIGAAIEGVVRSNGYSVVRAFVGHGVGAELHEDPQIPNYGVPGRGVRLAAGMTLAIEPMVCQFGAEVRVLPDNWTVVTADGGLAAHFEHTVVITEQGHEILTKI